MSEKDTLLEFPCDFPVKIVGKADEGFAGMVTEIVARHAGPLEPDHVRGRPSRDGKFIALTCLIRAQSKAQLDGLYEELSRHPDILMVL